MDNGRLNRKLLILLCVPGIVGLFLPFTYEYSPLSAIRYDELYGLAGPFFLSIVIFHGRFAACSGPPSRPLKLYGTHNHGLQRIAAKVGHSR